MAIIQPSVGPIKSDLRWVNARIGSTTLKELNHWSIVPLVHGYAIHPLQGCGGDSGTVPGKTLAIHFAQAPAGDRKASRLDLMNMECE
jgi:hypothetical protein